MLQGTPRREEDRRLRKAATYRAWYLANKEKKHASVRAWMKQNPEKVRNRKLKAAYGITTEERDSILAAQGGACAICLTTDPGRGKAWNVDHCHDTGTVRGVLCTRCNLMLGHARNSRDVLAAAIKYLKKCTSDAG